MFISRMGLNVIWSYSSRLLADTQSQGNRKIWIGAILLLGDCSDFHPLIQIWCIHSNYAVFQITLISNVGTRELELACSRKTEEKQDLFWSLINALWVAYLVIHNTDRTGLSLQSTVYFQCRHLGLLTWGMLVCFSIGKSELSGRSTN